MSNCPIHHIPMKVRILGLDITRSPSKAKLSKKEWEKYVDDQHKFAVKMSFQNAVLICPKCCYVRRLE